jgi:putative phosphoesterase
MTIYIVGVISDTHGLLRPEAADYLKGSDAIIHAGDVGGPAVLEALNAIAPTYAVRGNTDSGPWAQRLPDKEMIEIASNWFYILHMIEDLDLDPSAAGCAAVIYGHTHRPEQYQKDGVLFFNPGSAGPLRYKTAATLGRLFIRKGHLDSEIFTLIQ